MDRDKQTEKREQEEVGLLGKSHLHFGIRTWLTIETCI